MTEWRRLKAVRRLTWAAIGLAIFPGLFFVTLTSHVSGWSLESLLALYPSAIVGGIAFILYGFRPKRPPVMNHWRPEAELLGAMPRPVEKKWSTPKTTAALLLWLIPAFFLLMVVTGVRDFSWANFGVLVIFPILASGIACFHSSKASRTLLTSGEVVRGVIRRIIRARGVFRLKVEYEVDGENFFAWTDNLSQNSWFGPLWAEERLYVTLLVDPEQPDQFVVYPFCDHEIVGPERAWTLRNL